MTYTVKVNITEIFLNIPGFIVSTKLVMISVMLQKYLDNLPAALINYQYIEESLKQYIYRTEIMTAKKGAAVTDSKVDEKLNNAITKLSTANLIKMFARRNINFELIANLQALPSKNIFQAHHSHLVITTFSNKADIAGKFVELVRIIAQLEKCVYELIKELDGLEKRFGKIQMISAA